MIDMLRVMVVLKRFMFAGSLALSSLHGNAGTDTWEVITDLKQIAAVRQELNKPNLSLQPITIVRMTTLVRTTDSADESEDRVEVTSIGPTVVGFERGGPPAARSIMTFARKPERLVLFSQDVRNRTAFRLDIPMDQLVANKPIRFPVVQASGELAEQVFIVKEIITR